MSNQLTIGWSTRASLLLVPALLLACESPTEIPSASDPVLAESAMKGGKGKPSAGPEHPISLTGEMATPEGPQLAVLETDSKNKLEINGWKDEDCTDPDDPSSGGTCFRNELHLAVPAGSCGVPSGMTDAERDAILAVLDDSPAGASSQARWHYEVDIDKRRGTALVREFFYETGDPDRYDVLVNVDSASETPANSDVWTLSGGEVSVYHDARGPVSCPWGGQFVMTIGTNP